MQITAFKAMLARKLTLEGAKNIKSKKIKIYIYKNTFARMESDCTLRFGFDALIKNISCTKQSNLFLLFLSTQDLLKRFKVLKKCRNKSPHTFLVSKLFLRG